MQKALPYTIRPMELDDIPAVVAIDRLSFPTPWSPSSYSYELRHRHTSFYYVLLRPLTKKALEPEQRWRRWLQNVASLNTQESNVIGYLGLRLRNSGSHISTIAIHPEWRGNGLGELLLLTAIEHSLAMTCDKVTLEVRPSNPIAQKLYRKYGFQFTGIHAGYYRDGEDAWLMTVEIDRATYQTKLSKLRQALETRLDQSIPNSTDVSGGQNYEGKL
jgi:ribosomal-protein-alanine N-acetyltransferase